MALASTSTMEMRMRAVGSDKLLAGYQAEMDRFYSDALVRGSAAVLFKWDDRPSGYSQGHWRKIKKQRLASLPMTVKVTRAW
jgi:hypothetical protein